MTQSQPHRHSLIARLHSRWQREPRFIRIGALVLLLVCLLAGTYWGAREWVALRAADHVTVTITPSFDSTPHIIYQHTFGRSVATQAEHLLHDQTWVFSRNGVVPGSVGTGSHPTWTYHLTFTWHGIVVEDASFAYTDVDPEIVQVSALGLKDRYPREGYQLALQLASFSNSAIPLPPAD